MKIAVLGAGMVGRTIAADLSQDYSIVSIDNNLANLALLKPGIKGLVADLRQYKQYKQLLSPYDMVVCAVPGFMGYKALEAIIKAKKNVVDISFFPEDALALDALAKSNGVTAIVDCGVAPGMSNLVLGHWNDKMTINNFECLVGGLPKKRVQPFEYKAPFSPVDVIEEYTRPARYVENGHVIIKPALSDPELINFEQAGTLESFNTDGLRSLIHTMGHIPNMKEKTLRYPGHIHLVRSLQLAGFFSTEPVQLNGQSIVPLEYTSRILFDQWKLEAGEPEFTIMRIVMEGKLKDKPVRVEYTLYDEFDADTQTSSMSRTTGYTCTAAVNLQIKGLFKEQGVFPPELVGSKAGCFEFIMEYLKARNVVYQFKATKV